jgi:hypothetical protein
VAIEDLSRVRRLALLALGRSDDSLKPTVQAKLPQAAITILPPVSDGAKARDTITAFFAGS